MGLGGGNKNGDSDDHGPPTIRQLPRGIRPEIDESTMGEDEMVYGKYSTYVVRLWLKFII